MLRGHNVVQLLVQVLSTVHRLSPRHVAPFLTAMLIAQLKECNQESEQKLHGSYMCQQHCSQ